MEQGATPRVIPMHPTGPVPPIQAGELSLEYLGAQVNRLNLAVYGMPENNYAGLLAFRRTVEDHMRQMQRLQWWFAGLTVGLGVELTLSMLDLIGKVPLP